MKTLAFKDDFDGYYQVEVEDDYTELPEWCQKLTPCDVVISPELPVPVPQTLTNYQGKVTLDAFQLYDEVEAYMIGPNASRAAKFAWATGAFERQGTFVLEVAAAKVLSDSDVDQMFIYGSKVE